MIEEQENGSKLFRTRNLDVEIEITQEDSQTNGAPTPDIEEVLISKPTKDHQHHEVTMLKGDKNQNGKRNTNINIIGEKDRNISKKREKLKLQNIP